MVSRKGSVAELLEARFLVPQDIVAEGDVVPSLPELLLRDRSAMTIHPHRAAVCTYMIVLNGTLVEWGFLSERAAVDRAAEIDLWRAAVWAEDDASVPTAPVGIMTDAQ